jgi:hypothetical protein
MRLIGKTLALWSALLYSGAPPVVEITLPPANYGADEHTARSMGRAGAHLALHYILLGPAHYVWWNHGTSPDPGAFLAALSGRTGIEVTLAASAQTATQNATAVAAAVDAIAGMSASAAGAVVAVEGAGSASGGATSYSGRGREGILGCPDNRAFTEFSTPGNTIRGSVLDATRWDSRPIVLTGFALGIGTQHSAAGVIAVYQGGSAGLPGGATLVGHLGSTSGSGTNTIERVASSGVYVDPADGLIWIMAMYTAGQTRFQYTYGSQASTAGHDWLTTSNNRIYVPGNGTASSDPDDLPATLTNGDTGDDATGMLAIQISFVDAATFQCDVMPAFPFGTMAGSSAGLRDATFEFSSSTAVRFVAGNAYDIPATMRGLELLSLSINYAVHTSGEDLAGHLGVGGDAVDDWSGATVHHVGPAGEGGTATGWVETATAAAGIPLAAGTRVRLLIESGDDSTENAFDVNASDVFEAPVWGAASWYQGNTSESGYEPGTSTPTTNLSFDAAIYGVQAGQTAAAVIVPNGDLVSDDNNAGIFGTAITRGFAVAVTV